MIRHPADRVPVALIVSLTLIDIVLFLTIDNVFVLGAWFLLTLLPKGCICAWNHHHQHTKTFRSTAANRALELCYALHTGVSTHLWLLHHVLGHHHNYLDQAKDESRWRRVDGTPMGQVEYILMTALTSYPRGFRVGLRYPRLLRVHLFYTALTLLIVAGLVWWRPVPALFIFVLPMISGLLITAWATYDHHAGLGVEDDFTASYNQLNPVFNLLTGNLGYHTAHHHKQGTHWSELPALHARIADRIPAELYRKSGWDSLTSVAGQGFKWTGWVLTFGWLRPSSG